MIDVISAGDYCRKRSQLPARRCKTVQKILKNNSKTANCNNKNNNNNKPQQCNEGGALLTVPVLHSSAHNDNVADCSPALLLSCETLERKPFDSLPSPGRVPNSLTCSPSLLTYRYLPHTCIPLSLTCRLLVPCEGNARRHLNHLPENWLTYLSDQCSPTDYSRLWQRINDPGTSCRCFDAHEDDGDDDHEEVFRLLMMECNSPPTLPPTHSVALLLVYSHRWNLHMTSLSIPFFVLHK